ncbi:NUDIX hydrolase [Burkholderia pyrrocinia]|uniref:NUDIX hydrolase n=1 Tax=Burkholderia pyrrocinia TaxID=60550 RepID=UPI0038B42EEB
MAKTLSPGKSRETSRSMSPFAPPSPGRRLFLHAASSVRGHAMKQRATVLCRRGDRILLVARLHARWVLPGGGPHRGESPADAARRELREETGLVCRNPRRLFGTAGRNKFHHVFVADIDDEATANPASEIARCAWIDRRAVASLDCSRPTPFIVDRALALLDRERQASHYSDDLFDLQIA